MSSCGFDLAPRIVYYGFIWHDFNLTTVGLCRTSINSLSKIAGMFLLMRYFILEMDYQGGDALSSFSWFSQYIKYF